MDVEVTPESAKQLSDKAFQLQLDRKYDDAAWLYKQSIAIWESVRGPEDPLVAQGRCNLAAVYRETNDYHEAENQLQIAQRIWMKRGFPKQFDTEFWADSMTPAGMFTKFAARLKDMRDRLERGDSAARTQVEESIKRLGPWYHNVVLAPGVMTHPTNADYPLSRWRILNKIIPQDLRGKSVLDIGCNSGFFSLEMKRRGADRVVGVDIMPYLLSQARFNSHWFNLPLELHECGVYDVESLGCKFDVVLFIGVLYHLKHPLYALEKLASICNETMIFQSVVRGPTGDVDPAEDYPILETEAFDQPAWPKLYFIEKKFNGDESNWWFATQSCLRAMLRTSGFSTVTDTANEEIFVCQK